jgi:hypothetical protein
MRRPFVYVGIFAVALATLMLEILLTRITSVIAWYHLAFFVIALAMLGMTAGAVIVFLWPRAFADVPRRLFDSALCFAPARPAGAGVDDVGAAAAGDRPDGLRRAARPRARAGAAVHGGGRDADAGADAGRIAAGAGVRGRPAGRGARGGAGDPAARRARRGVSAVLVAGALAAVGAWAFAAGRTDMLAAQGQVARDSWGRRAGAGANGGGVGERDGRDPPLRPAWVKGLHEDYASHAVGRLEHALAGDGVGDRSSCRRCCGRRGATRRPSS